MASMYGMYRTMYVQAVLDRILRRRGHRAARRYSRMWIARTVRQIEKQRSHNRQCARALSRRDRRETRLRVISVILAVLVVERVEGLVVILAVCLVGKGGAAVGVARCVRLLEVSHDIELASRQRNTYLDVGFSLDGDLDLGRSARPTSHAKDLALLLESVERHCVVHAAVSKSRTELTVSPSERMARWKEMRALMEYIMPTA